MDDPKNIIYGLTDPRDGALRYIGQSCRGIRRAHQHRSTSGQKFNHHKINWIRKLQSLGMTYGVVFIECLDTAEGLNEREVWWIALGRAWGCRLLNATDGGEGARGFKPSEESIAKMRTAHLGKKLSEATKAKMSSIRLGRHHSTESRKRMSEMATGRTVSRQTRDKLSAIFKGREKPPRSEEHRERLSASRRGKPLSAEQRRKLSEASRTAVATEEWRNKMKPIWRQNGERFKEQARKRGPIRGMGPPRGPLPDETKAKISASSTGKVMSETMRAKMRAIWLGRRVAKQVLSTQQGPM